MVAKDIDRRAHSRRGGIDQPLGKLPARRDGERRGNAHRVEFTGSQSGHIEPEARPFCAMPGEATDHCNCTRPCRMHRISPAILAPTRVPVVKTTANIASKGACFGKADPCRPRGTPLRSGRPRLVSRRRGQPHQSARGQERRLRVSLTQPRSSLFVLPVQARLCQKRQIVFPQKGRCG